MFDSPDPMLTWSVVGGVALAAVLRHARRDQARADQQSLVSDALIACESARARPLHFTAGDGPDGPVVVDLAEQPHVLVAGMTGSGKSTFVTSMLVDLLAAHSPDDLRLVLIDPKRVELAAFQEAPHVLSFAYDIAESVAQLEWLCAEMERRYEALASVRLRRVEEATGLPRIVVVIEELANLMLSRHRHEVEEALVRLASMGRAAGIHLVLVTQRPSVDVVTGVLKANVPARVAMAVATTVDSRVILDRAGAEELEGRGDLLLSLPASRHLVRLQGRRVPESEVGVAPGGVVVGRQAAAWAVRRT